MNATFPQEWTNHEKRQWLIRAIANAEARLKRLEELEAPDIIIKAEKNIIHRRQEDLEEVSKED